VRLQLFSADDVAAALPMRDCVEVMKRAFADFSSGRAQVPQRTVMAVGEENVLLVKPAWVPELPPRGEGEKDSSKGGASGGLGAKLVSFYPGNAAKGLPVTAGLVILVSPVTGEPVALIDGTFLTAWRTGAASGAATDLLARPDAAIGAVFGAGAQANTQVLAIDAVRELEEIRVYARDPSLLESFVAGLQAVTRATLRAARSPRAAVREADVICTATPSKNPVFDGMDVKPCAHVNGVGSFQPTMQEIDIETVRRSRVFVDSLASATVEPGDLLEAIAAGVTDPAEWTELGAVVEGGRLDPGDRELTFFKSVGLAVQDIAAGAAVLERAAALGLGRTIEV
jgi:ornithine cyclodeaminase